MKEKSLSSHQQAAKALRDARIHKKPIQRISETYGIEGIEAAYAVAEINTGLELSAGKRISGKKVGLTSKAVQQQSGVDQPDFGILFSDMECLNAQEVSFSRLIQPKVEAEVAFVIANDFPHHRPTWSEFLKNIAYAFPAIEIVDSAITDWKITLVDTVADNASSGLYVLGDQPVAMGQIALDKIGMQLEKNGHVASMGNGAACLGHPLRAAYWLACTMTERGQTLKAGEVILSGALGPMVQVQAGDLVQVHIGALGYVSTRISQ